MDTGATRALAERVWARWLALDPLAAIEPASNVLDVGAGSITEAEAFASAGRQLMAELDAIEPAKRCHDDDLTAGFLRWLLGTWIEYPDRYWFEFPITPYAAHRRLETSATALRAFTFLGKRDTRDYLDLIDSQLRHVEQIESTLREQTRRGICLSRAAHATALGSLRSSYRTIVDLVVPEPTRLDALDRSVRSTFADALGRLVADSLIPTYERLIAYVESEYGTQLVDGVGLGQYPGGQAAYRSAARYWTTTEQSVEELHALGLEQVELLTAEMAAIRSTLRFSGSEHEFHESLAADPRFFARTPGEVGACYLKHIGRIEPQLTDLFSRRQRAPYGVTPLDASLESSITYGFYDPPTSSKAHGDYVYNGSALTQRSLLASASLILHELLPGHHLQIALQLENRALPEVRRQSVLTTTAYIEGWAEYAAGLGWELGAYEDPYDQYGRLTFERFFAQRLVVDTGMNALGWSLERGRKYMKANTLESDVQIASETLRYATDTPGQALAYRPGHLAFAELRSHASATLGAEFDVRRFHDAVLGAGALPMPLLASHVEWWIAQEKRGRPGE